MGLSHLQDSGVVKTARKEAESILLLRALVTKQAPMVKDSSRLVKLSRENKVVLRAASVLNFPAEVVDRAKEDAAEAFQLYDTVSKALEKERVGFVVLKSFDSLPDIGHDLDFLVASPSDFSRAVGLMVKGFKVEVQPLTPCDVAVGKFSCFLPGFKHDFEMYPAISQHGEEYVSPADVMSGRKKGLVESRSVWLTSDADRVLIRVVHAMFRHTWLKLSDILDFIALTGKCTPREVVDSVERAGIGDAFLFYLATVERFLRACGSDSENLASIRAEAERRFGQTRLGFLRRDRLVLPYRIRSLATLVLFLQKAHREMARGRVRNAIRFLRSPPLMLIDFYSQTLVGKKIW